MGGWGGQGGAGRPRTPSLRAHSKRSPGASAAARFNNGARQPAPPPHRDTGMTQPGALRSPHVQLQSPYLWPQRCRSCRDCAGTHPARFTASLDPGILQEPPMLPLRHQHNLRLFPAVVTRKEASALPVNLPNLESGFTCLKGKPLTSVPPLLDRGHGWGALALCRARKLRELLPSRFSGAHPRPRLSGGLRPTEPSCLGGSLADLPRPGPSPKCGQLLESGWI